MRRAEKYIKTWNKQLSIKRIKMRKHYMHICIELKLNFVDWKKSESC